MRFRLFLLVFIGCFSACQITYPIQQLTDCASAERQTLEAGWPQNLPISEGPCHRIKWNAEYSFWVLPVPHSEQWFVGTWWLQYVDKGIVEQAIPLVFQTQDQQPTFLHARPARLLSFPCFTLQDYELARTADVEHFPHRYFLHSLLVHSLVGDLTSFELLQRYGNDFQEALEVHRFREDYEEWLALARSLRPTQPYVEAAHAPPPLQLVFEGDPNAVQYSPPNASASKADSGRAGFIQQGNTLLAVADWQAAPKQVQVYLSIPIHGGMLPSFELDGTLDVVYSYSWNSALHHTQGLPTVTLLSSSSSIEAIDTMPPTALLQAEHQYVEGQQWPPPAHANRVAKLLTHAFYRLLTEPLSTGQNWKTVSTQFNHTLRYHPAVAHYHRQLQHLVDLQHGVIHCTSCQGG